MVFARKIDDSLTSLVKKLDKVSQDKKIKSFVVMLYLLAPWTADKELARGSLRMRPLSAKPVTRNWVLYSLSTHRYTLAEETFSKLCRQHAAGMRLDRRDIKNQPK